MIQRWRSRCIFLEDWHKVDGQYAISDEKKSERLTELFISLARRLEFPNQLPIFIKLSEIQFGWEWHVDAHFVSAQQSVQRTAFGSGMRAWLANKIIGLGWWLAGIGSR